MQNEELNKEAARKINEWADTILVQIAHDTIDSDSYGYTQYNLIMNVLTGCMVKMMSKLPNEMRQTFIDLVHHNLTENKKNLIRKGE